MSAKGVNGERLNLQRVKDSAKKMGGDCLNVVELKNQKDPIHLKCKLGHAWTTTPFSLIYRGNWCPTCAINLHKLDDTEKKFGLDRLKATAQSLDGLCLSKEYFGVSHKYSFSCKVGHKWETTGKNLLTEQTWCPTCSGKAGETFSIEHAAKVTGFQFKKVRPKWLRGRKGYSLELDAYCEEQKFAIEYQGEQHYKFVPGWHKTIEAFEEARGRDFLKQKLCAEHGVLLFEVTFIDRPTPGRIAAHVECEAQKACIPFAINPDYRAMLAELSTDNPLPNEGDFSEIFSDGSKRTNEAR